MGKKSLLKNKILGTLALGSAAAAARVITSGRISTLVNKQTQKKNMIKCVDIKHKSNISVS